jgi:hypothetical protein
MDNDEVDRVEGPSKRLQSTEGCSEEALDDLLLVALQNPKDRLFLLKLDKDMRQFMADKRSEVFNTSSSMCSINLPIGEIA